MAVGEAEMYDNVAMEGSVIFEVGRLYLDNAATSFPKPPGMAASVAEYIEQVGMNAGRGSYQKAFAAEEMVLQTRLELAEMFHFSEADKVILTMNVTYALNMLIKGLLRPGDHCLVSSLEHNAVMRPLVQLQGRGVSFDRIPCTENGMDLTSLPEMVRENTRAVIMTHASNVNGLILPIAEVGAFCKDRKLFFILDAAQTAGAIDVSFPELNLSALAFTGHKSLLGPQGTGGFLATGELLGSLSPLISGGTGSLSDSEDLPPHLPDRFEAGTHNMPGIAGLASSLRYIKARTIEAIRAHEMRLTGLFLDSLTGIAGVRVLGPQSLSCRTGVVSLDFADLDNALVTHRLDTEYGIMTRCGMHCAPAAHRSFGTYPQGTVRFSFGAFNCESDVERAAIAIRSIAAG